MEVLGPARADIGSPGFNGLGVISNNDAQYGGGIDILTFNDGANALVRLFSTDANNPVTISDNFASHAGGAVYLKPFLSLFSAASSALCAYDFHIDRNDAPEGAAIYADSAYDSLGDPLGSGIALNTNPIAQAFGAGSQICVKTEPPTALGAVACAPGVQCTRFLGNKTEDEGGQATAGSIILVQDAGDLEADRVIAERNTGAHLVRIAGNGVHSELTNSLLAQNTLTAELMADADTDDYLSLDLVTIADNSIGSPQVMNGGHISLSNSIIAQPGLATINPAIGDGTQASHVLTNDRSTLPDTVYIELGAPVFVNAVGGDYHLTQASLGVDNAPVDTNYNAPHLDLDRHTRVVDLPGVANNFGPMDLGAYEIQLPCAAADTIFCDGFEQP